MANKKMFSMEWQGLDELVNELENMSDKTEQIIKNEYSKFGLLVEEGAKALAHHDKGDLEDSINSTGAEIFQDEIMVEVGVGSEYGVRRHEEKPRKGKHPKYDNGAKFPKYYKNGLGAKTRSKGSWRGEKPGRKFLERAVDLTERDFQEMNERALARIMTE